MWKTSCLEIENHRIHMEERAWRIIDWARNNDIIYSEEEIKNEILDTMKNFSKFEDLGIDYETSLPKMKVEVVLSKTHFPIYLIIIEDEQNNTRMIKTVWTVFEEKLKK